MTKHELLGKRLRGFESGGGSHRPKDPKALFLEKIDDPRGEWVIGTDKGQIDLFRLGKCQKAGQIARRDRMIGGKFCCPCIPRGTEEICHTRALSELPEKRMLTATRSDYENFHRVKMNGARGVCREREA
jgi:hypothetical protein